MQQNWDIAAIPIKHICETFYLTKIISDYMDAGYKAIDIHVKFYYNHLLWYCKCDLLSWWKLYIIFLIFFLFILAAKYPNEDSELEKSEIRAFQKTWLSQIPLHKTLHLNTPYHPFSNSIQLSSNAKTQVLKDIVKLRKHISV